MPRPVNLDASLGVHEGAHLNEGARRSRLARKRRSRTELNRGAVGDVGEVDDDLHDVGPVTRRGV